MHKEKLVAIAFAVACGGDAGGGDSGTPTNFAGSYTVTVTNGEDHCDGLMTTWQPGESDANIPMTITQDMTVAQIEIKGAAAFILDEFVGTAIFAGSVSGDSFTASVLGTKSQMSGACTYTTDATLVMSIDSQNQISGTITYTQQTNGDPSCGVLSTCSNVQNVAGARTSN